MAEYAVRLERTVTEVEEASRASFLRYAYGHLLGAIVLLTLVEILVQDTGLAKWLVYAGGGAFSLPALILLGWLARRTAKAVRSTWRQYAALAGFAAAGAFVYGPFFWIICHKGPVVPEIGAAVTLAGFAALAVVGPLTTSFPLNLLAWGASLALLLGAASKVYELPQGTGFSAAIVAYACAAVLFAAPRILRGFGPGRYAAAALDLMAAMVFFPWYVLMHLVSLARSHRP